MASFRKRGKTWQYTVELGIDPATGKRKQKTKGGFRTKKEAELAAAKIEKEIFDGTYVEESKITFVEFFPIWLEYYSKYVKPGTVEVRKTAFNTLKKYLGHIMMRKITKPMYVKMLHDLHEQGSSENTIKAIHSTASLVFKYALNEERIIKFDPTANVDFRFLKVERTASDKLTLKDSEKFLEKEDLAKFLQVAKARRKEHPQDYIIFLTLAYTGLRRGELSVLKWTDVDMDNHTISINKTFSFGDSKRANDFVLAPPKTIESNRVIDVDEFIIEQLKIHRSWQKEYMMRNRDRYVDQDFVFINTNKYPGYPVPPQYIYDHMKSILKQMEYPINLSPHSMRHTHASLCIEAGIPLRDISERLGHTDMNMLEKIYAHTTKGQKEKTSKKFNQLMEKVRLEYSF